MARRDAGCSKLGHFRKHQKDKGGGSSNGGSKKGEKREKKAVFSIGDDPSPRRKLKLKVTRAPGKGGEPGK